MRSIQAMMIVMEYAAGGTLYDLIEQKSNEGKYMDEDEIAHLFAQIVLPLHLVHSRCGKSLQNRENGRRHIFAIPFLGKYCTGI